METYNVEDSVSRGGGIGSESPCSDPCCNGLISAGTGFWLRLKNIPRPKPDLVDFALLSDMYPESNEDAEIA